jgi:hypothetical protein
MQVSFPHATPPHCGENHPSWTPGVKPRGRTMGGPWGAGAKKYP